MSLKGVDISKYNGNCDFKKAKDSGIDFVIIKAGSGASGKDPFWDKNYNYAKAAELGVGAYWYCYATSVEQAKREAREFVGLLKDKKLDYPAYLDLEDNKYQGCLGNKLRTDIAEAFCEVVQNAGYYTGIYSMMSWFNSKFDMSRLKKYDLWIARWRDINLGVGYSGLGQVGMWQYSNQGRISGIGNTGEGGVDVNIAYLNYPSIISGGISNIATEDIIESSNTASNEAQKMINKINAWLGKSEANRQHKDIIDIYNNHRPLPRGYKVKYTDEWCATTISAAAIQCGLVDKIGKECSVQRFIDIFKQKGIWIEDGCITPIPGDIICFNWDNSTQPNDGWADHIGLVEKVSNGRITVIEGNNNESVKKREIPIAWGYIRGYARPCYCGVSTNEGWKKENNKWVFYKNSKKVCGWLKDKNKWYYIDPKTKEMITGWLKYNNNWFYFNNNGSMHTGWLEYNNKWYYFNSNGYMHIGWLKYNGHKFYFDDDGSMISDCSLILNGTEYVFDSKGYMQQLNICRN
ncbi:Putative cell wall binding repeat-containing protein [Peptostreptococcus russellii]|uniref:Putative cell wall binding repeat-containing protein n=1 Tax=Peptostreptococcus russellii TaxID=215200 RepID=A0A1H8JYA3_9FIRM|nr:GH25 family lysozyme [Peptostreptococcus russellii]SEN85724.1 Putative cell wall binding repeat-containing protein [Peptostreptococcus russellii]